MGAVLTQRPELFRAVVIQVPLLDMLRYHRFLIARLWIPEYGSADDPEQFPWLAAYSPYHHVRDGRGLPRGAAGHGGERHAGGPDARAEDGGAAAGRDRARTIRCCSGWNHGRATGRASRSPRCWTSWWTPGRSSRAELECRLARRSRHA